MNKDVIYTHTHAHKHTQNGVLLSHKMKERNIAFCSNMGGSRDDHIEWSQSEREKYVYHFIRGILKK